MAVKVLALASGVTGLADHRELNGSLVIAQGTTGVRTGLLHNSGYASFSAQSAMVLRIAPLKCIINNGVASNLGPYLVVSDANVDLTFADGEASVTRTDRVIVRVYDNANDGSGSTQGTVEYLKGQASGAATSLPTNSMLLYDFAVPAGASSGSGGINFSSVATEQRVYTASNGSVILLNNVAGLATITQPSGGQMAWIQSINALYIYDGFAAVWKNKGQVQVSNSAQLTNISNPYDGLMAVTRDTDALWVYDGSTWVQPKTNYVPVGSVRQSVAQSLTSGSATAITFTGTEFIDTHNYHNPSSNSSRVTPLIAGYYSVVGTLSVVSAAYTQVSAAIGVNGTRIAPQVVLRPDAASSAAQSVQTTTIVSMNGSTDYFELYGSQNSSGAQNTNVSAGFESSLQWNYIGPTSY